MNMKISRDKVSKYLFEDNRLLVTLAVINIVLTIIGVVFIAYIN